MEFCELYKDFISNIPDFYCTDCRHCPKDGDAFNCPYHRIIKPEITPEVWNWEGYA